MVLKGDTRSLDYRSYELLSNLLKAGYLGGLYRGLLWGLLRGSF